MMIRYPKSIESMVASCGWQVGWEVRPSIPLPSIPAWGVARAAEGTPVPEGAIPYASPEVTAEMVVAARRDLERALAAGIEDPIERELAEGYVENEEGLVQEIRRHLGLADWLAAFAPLAIQTPEEAGRTMAAAESLWDSRCSCGVFRTAPRGYRVWIGVGSMLTPAGHANTPAQAEAMAVEAVMARRREVMREVSRILAGWPPDTPFYSATVATAAKTLPIHVRRGPMTRAEAPGARVIAAGAVMGGSSWDLPVVAEYADGRVIRHDERVTWDDAASRRRHEERQREGEARRRLTAGREMR